MREVVKEVLITFVPLPNGWCLLVIAAHVEADREPGW
jgi:hypothetical protein